MDKVLELAKKLKALAAKGIGGEKTNADKMLKDLMKKHGIALDDIAKTEREYREFKYEPNQAHVLAQVAFSVVGAATEIKEVDPKHCIYYIKCTPAEFIEIQASFSFYWDAYEKSLKTFNHAFFVRNELYSKDAEPTDSALSDAEWDKIQGMMESIDKSTMHKQIESGKE